MSAPPQRSSKSNTNLLPIIKHLKDTYLIWFGYFQKLPKIHRYTLGLRVDNLFVEIIENLSSASFSKSLEKQDFISLAIRKNDTLKVLMIILWETKSIDNKEYIFLSKQLDEMGKMLGGWISHLQKQNSPGNKLGEKRED
ncbi:four helix bundle protein [candidate division WWE3 bacterium]|uniref:Four helix bundle protein n=1 Tax=candidate division WWE3 bacterium TaxID=2053526 RepID=A0A7X9E7Q1_UNCKA|nr:four helix bundle protein [candidate division WWE3 bacterium]